MNPSGAEKTFFRADHCAFPLGKDYDVGFQTMLRSCGSRYISRVRCVNMSLTSALKSELKTAFQWFVDVFLSGTISFIFKKSISISPCCLHLSIYARKIFFLSANFVSTLRQAERREGTFMGQGMLGIHKPRPIPLQAE